MALLGEIQHAGCSGPVRTTDVIEVLSAAGVAGSATRAALDRYVLSGLLTRDRVGRGIEYRITDLARGVLGEASARVHAEEPFHPRGEGWTLVTFSVPEGQRAVRHRLRSALTWEGFGPLRDGLWIASGERDPGTALEELRDELASSGVLAFHARDLAAFPVGDALRGAWDLAMIRSEHDRFLAEWGGPASAIEAEPLSQLTTLVADWLELLRCDPRLPEDMLGADWPAASSLALYRSRRAEIERAAGLDMRKRFGARA